MHSAGANFDSLLSLFPRNKPSLIATGRIIMSFTTKETTEGRTPPKRRVVEVSFKFSCLRNLPIHVEALRPHRVAASPENASR